MAGTAAALALQFSSARSARALARSSARAAAAPAHRAPAPRALLISNSKVAGLDYLDHAEAHIKDFLGEPGGSVLFVPFALAAATATRPGRRRASRPGDARLSMHEFDTAARRAAVREAACLFVGGGNTYRLLGVAGDPRLAARRASRRARCGTSAARRAPTSRARRYGTPTTCRSCGQRPGGPRPAPFQINTTTSTRPRAAPHGRDARRLEEFMEENAVPIVALREGSVLVRGGAAATPSAPPRRRAGELGRRASTRARRRELAAANRSTSWRRPEAMRPRCLTRLFSRAPRRGRWRRQVQERMTACRLCGWARRGRPGPAARV